MSKNNLKNKVLSLFNENADITTREIEIENSCVYLFYIDCLVDSKFVAESIVKAIIDGKKKENMLSCLEKSVIAGGKITRVEDDETLKKEIFNASVIIGVEGEKNFLAVSSAGFSKRSIAEPPTSSVVRGPREGFIEDLETNLSLLRRRLKNPSLAIKRLTVGKRTSTNVALVYLDGIVSPKLIKHLEKNINEIDIDGIIDSYYLEEILQESKETFFKKVGNSEKPDVIAARILEGRVAIVVDGSPIVLSVPFIFFEDLQSPSDYYDVPQRSSFVRIVRIVGLLLAILLPGFYVAFQSYHYRVLPINFLISLLSSIEGISFPPILEILFVLFLFEILNEASVRMPKQLGMALSIIGALVLGDTAVQAGIITPPSIVVVAISGITLYIIPNQSSEASILRTIFTIIGGFAGFYGLFLGFIILASYLVSINTYNTPYLAPYAPSVRTDKKDGFIKSPLSQMIYRPKSFRTLNTVRQRPTERFEESAKQERRVKEGK